MTAAFALAMVLVLAIAGIFVYLRLRADLDETIDSGLRSRSDDVAAVVRRSDGALSRAGGNRLAESEESFVQVLTPAGRWVDGTSRVPDPALRPAEARRASVEPTMLERKVLGVDGKARMLARPVLAGRSRLVVVTGAQLEDRDDALSGLLTSFLVGGPVAVLLASGIGYVLATAGLAPIEAMRRRAREISLSREGERLPLPAANDEVRRLGETLNEMLARLEVSFEQERRFVADASHELRTPVAVVKAELEAALRTQSDDAKARLPLVAALEEADHLAHLAEDLLLIARAGDGRLPVRREDVDVRQMLEQTGQRFADRAREQGRSIRIEVADDLKASLDPLRARQALGNLVDNALRYGSGDVRLSARRGKSSVEIEVSDAGPGFPPELAPRAFERFARGGAARTRSGAGLGLAIVRAIAEAHGGTAAIVDSRSEGAAIRLSFPLAAQPAR